ncbi:MAG: NUDIX domain-containing protein [Patescibacteria group bacterium]
MEFLPIVFEDSGELTGECLPRLDVIAKAAWCRTTNVFVMDLKGRILCHRRSMEKERLPGVWMTHLGGHVGQGETYEENAQKELFEEAGIEATSQELIAWRTTKILKQRLWVREFVVLKDVSILDVKMQAGEVDQIAWMTIEEILESYSKDPSRWCAGTHDFYVEYHCLRAALTAAEHAGIITPTKSIGAWHPVAA